MNDFLRWTHYNPVRIKFGTLKELVDHVEGNYILLVTSAGFVKRGTVDEVVKILFNKKVIICDHIKSNPDWRDLDVIREKLKDKEIDCVIGMGGGSVIDTAKVLAASIKNPLNQVFKKYIEDAKSIESSQKLPLIVIPTTAGTGAEVTPFATIWDHIRHQKYSISGNFIYPNMALIDVSLTLSLNEDDTIYPALDSISHALESLWNKNSTPITKAYALSALNYSLQAIPALIMKPKDIQARAIMQTASLLSGLAISQSKTAIAHAISYPLTTHYHVPHGLACSFTLPKLLASSKTMLMKNGIDEHLLMNIEVLLRGLNLDARISEYLTIEQAFALLDFMHMPGRSDNFAYDYPGGVAELLKSSFPLS